MSKLRFDVLDLNKSDCLHPEPASCGDDVRCELQNENDTVSANDLWQDNAGVDVVAVLLELRRQEV